MILTISYGLSAGLLKQKRNRDNAKDLMDLMYYNNTKDLAKMRENFHLGYSYKHSKVILFNPTINQIVYYDDKGNYQIEQYEDFN